MFTGLIREVGRVVSFEDGRLAIESAQEAALGDSIAIDGVCLTVVAHEQGTLAFQAVPETLARTSLGTLEAGVEGQPRAGAPRGRPARRPLRAGPRRRRRCRAQRRARGRGQARSGSDAPAELLRYVVEKGSIARPGHEPDRRRGRRARLRGRADPAHARRRRRSTASRPATASTSRSTCSRNTSRSCLPR